MQWCKWAGGWRSHLLRQSAGPEVEDSFDFLFKIVLVGDSDVGKTCVVQSFKSGVFFEKQQNTIGVDFTVRTLDIDGKKVKMQVWDTAGQERFRTITQSYYRSAHGAMVAYDITRRPTFESVPHWIREVEQYGAASVVLILIDGREFHNLGAVQEKVLAPIVVSEIFGWTSNPAFDERKEWDGNKSDLNAQRQVLFEDACTLAENNSVLAALETSAKEAQNVEAAFILMARELLARNGMTITDEASQDSPQFMLSNNSHTIQGTVSSEKNCGCRRN